MRYDTSLPIAVWRALIAKAIEDLEARQGECEEARKGFLTEEDIKMLKLLVFGYVGLVLTSVTLGIIAAGVWFLAMQQGPPL